MRLGSGKRPPASSSRHVSEFPRREFLVVYVGKAVRICRSRVSKQMTCPFHRLYFKESIVKYSRAPIVLSVFVAAVGWSAMVPSVAAEPPDVAKAQIGALEKRVAALERRMEAGATPASTPRRDATEAARSSATSVERYLQYPGQ